MVEPMAGLRLRVVAAATLGWLMLGMLLLAAVGCGDGTPATASGQRAEPATPARQTAMPETATAMPIPPLLPPSTPQPTSSPRPTPTATPAPIPTATPLPVVSRTLVFSGDVLSHTPVIAQAKRYGTDTELDYDYRPMFADIAPRLAGADLAICVLETPVSADDVGLDGYPTFEAPRHLPDALVHAGYDGCSTASNHSMDRGPDGVKVTLDQMDRVGLGHAGMARSKTEASVARIYDLDGVRVAHLSYTYSLNGFVLPDDEPWLVNLNDADTIVAEAEGARRLGADLVVLSIQWGNEYQRQPSPEQEALAETLTASGVIDLIAGNHVHVVQPVTSVNGVPVIYGLGNSLSNQSDNCCRVGTQDGVIVQATVQGNADVGYEVSGLAFSPTWVDRSNFTIVDLTEALEATDLDPGRAAIYQTSFDRTIEAIQLLGMDIPLAP